MKPFLGIDLTSDRENEQPNGDEFIIDRPSSAMAQAVEETADRAASTIELSKLPRALRIIRTMCAAVALIIVSAALKAINSADGPTLAQAYEAAPALFWCAGICAVVWGVLMIMSLKKEKSVLETDESELEISRLKGICAAAFNEMGVPDCARDTDLIMFAYKEKNGKIKPYEGAQVAAYTNPIYKVFSDSENLYLANLEGKYAFPLSSLTAIRTVKKTVRLPEWNKDVRPKADAYKKYKINIDGYGFVCCKAYHILELNLGSEQWGIYFPNYELPTFEEVTGLKAQ